ncbi:hypothetical protein [Mesomycoplasma lagogenitalium]|uniref:VRR-NUC domain-containing protein n=1 Tax=Mesomycoplasma lagogenitalium TaxID=171286 RepID=A0ABY8LUS2_9BACT|nr:hypothetical protein [Mesomycoplasma lagogenitalium]WGI36465.1 hypothetical protein QEG99_03300 [Mesomycoplasma lagogenitalium]
MLEKNLEQRIKKFFDKNGINYFKIHGQSFQVSGIADLFVFHNFRAYALEVKRDLKKNKPTKLQTLQAKKYQKNLIYLFIDNNNYDFIIQNILKNNLEVLKHLSDKQIDYYIQFYKNGNKTTL